MSWSYYIKKKECLKSSAGAAIPELPVGEGISKMI